MPAKSSRPGFLIQGSTEHSVLMHWSWISDYIHRSSQCFSPRSTQVILLLVRAKLNEKIQKNPSKIKKKKKNPNRKETPKEHPPKLMIKFRDINVTCIFFTMSALTNNWRNIIPCYAQKKVMQSSVERMEEVRSQVICSPQLLSLAVCIMAECLIIWLHTSFPTGPYFI